MRKFHCFVDESGQDTLGARYYVALVLTEQDPEKLRGELLDIERKSGRWSKKWKKSDEQRRSGYMAQILQRETFAGGQLLFKEFRNRTDYFDCTAEAIAEAMEWLAVDRLKLTLVVDAIGVKEGQRMGSLLRKQGVSIRKVRGANDDTDPLIRLADSIAGFTRDAKEGQAYASPLFERATRKGMIIEIKKNPHG